MSALPNSIELDDLNEGDLIVVYTSNEGEIRVYAGLFRCHSKGPGATRYIVILHQHEMYHIPTFRISQIRRLRTAPQRGA